MTIIEQAAGTETVREWRIAASLGTAAAEKVAKVNKRLAKLGLPLYVLTITEAPDHVRYDLDTGEELGREARIDVKIVGSVPRLADWEPVAVLTRDADAGVITRVWPGLTNEPDLAVYRDTEPVCEHCHLDRNRTDTFVVRNTATGELSQVGRTCLAAYTGVEVGIPQWVATGDDGLDEMESWTGGADDLRWPVLHVLATALAIVGRWGWVSRQTSRDSYGERTATAEIVLDALSGNSESCRELRVLIGPDVAAAADKAILVQAYAAGLDGPGEYTRNLSAVAAAATGYVGVRNVALLASAVSGYNRDQEKRVLAAAPAAESNWVGTVKARLSLTLTVVSVSILDGYYGPTSLVTMLDEDGNRFKWFAANRRLDWAAGDTVDLKGTVKEHGQWQGVKETQLTRCTVATVTAADQLADAA